MKRPGAMTRTGATRAAPGQVRLAGGPPSKYNVRRTSSGERYDVNSQHGMSTRTMEGVVFDVGNVLTRVSYRRISKELARHSPLSAVAIQRELVGTDLEWDAETGKYDSREHFKRIKKRIQGDSGWTYEEFAGEFKSGLSMTRDGVAGLRYAAARARVFLMSNTPYLHGLWMFEQEILATLPEQLFFSYREGVMKPDPRIWEIFFERTRLPAEKCLYFDDRLENCEAVRRFGIHAVHFKSPEMNLLDEVSSRL